jgi:ABC-type oligopeptide transport system ATPase subunit
MAGQLSFIGKQVKAQYRTGELAEYQHNPYIEALGPILDDFEVFERIERRPGYREEERLLPPHIRLHAVQAISDLIHPLPIQIDYQHRISRLIRSGYKARNPLKVEWVKQVRAGFPNIVWGSEDDQYEPIIRSSADSFAIIGTSGVGKSTAIESVLGLYPQVITHTEYNGQPMERKQLVWLKLDCSHGGSIKGLCLNFFQSIDQVLGTKYHSRFKSHTVDQILPEMAAVSFNLGLGVLVIDEIQRLNEAHSGGADKMINFFVELVNTVGVPVVLCGTFQGLHLLQNKFSSTRRSEGQGNVIWNNYIKDEIWDDFIECLWEYQWTNVETPLTPAISKAIYDVTQGVTDIAVKLYKLVQWRVIGEEDERITASLIRQVAKESLTLSMPILDALKTKQYGKLQNIKDIYPAVRDMDKYLNSAEKRVDLIGRSYNLRNQEKTSKEMVDSPITQIAQWLVDAGIESKLALDCAKKTLALIPEEDDITKARRYAYNLAMRALVEEDLKSDNKVMNKVKPKKKKPELDYDAMREEAKEDKKKLKEIDA